MRTLFDVAKCYNPSVIFIDELDSLLSARQESEFEGSRRMKNELLVQMDGASGSSDDRVLVIGATNMPQQLDEAAIRRLTKRQQRPSMPHSPVAEATPTLTHSALLCLLCAQGCVSSSQPFHYRCDAVIAGPVAHPSACCALLCSSVADVPLPNLEARVQLLTRVLQSHDASNPGTAPHSLSADSIASIAAATRGYSGSDLHNLAKEAAMIPLRPVLAALAAQGGVQRGVEGEAGRRALAVPAIRYEDFVHALRQVKPSVRESDLQGHRKWNEQFGSFQLDTTKDD